MKRGKKMVLLIGLLGVLLIGYGLLGQMNETATVSETKGNYPLWTDSKTVSSLSWTQDGEALSFSLGESVWMKDDDAAFPVNQTAVQNLADKIEKLTAISELTDVTKPEDYGLADPAFAVTVKDESGSETVYAMGDQTPFEDGYYLSVTGSDNIYVIESSLATTFNKTLTQLATMESMPEVTSVTRMTVGNTLDVSYDEELSAWVDTATGEGLDSDAVSDLVQAAQNLTWSELIATSASDDDLSAWAVDDAQAVKLTLYNGEAAERVLLLGGTDEEGDHYARLPDSRMVYTFYSSDVDDLLEASIDTLWLKKLRGMTIDQIQSISFVWDGGETTLTSDDSESTTMQSIVEHLDSFEGTARVELGELGSEVLKLSVADVDGNAKDMAFYAYNVDSYLLPITDTHGMLVPAEDVDKLIRMLKQQA